MINRIGAPVGAGLASALLFVVGFKWLATGELTPGTGLAMPLAYLAPLPIMIAVLGWGARGGALACGVASAGVAVLVEWLWVDEAPLTLILIDCQTALLFALTIAMPGWALASFATLPGVRLPWRRGGGAPPEWMSVGAIVTLAAALAAAISLGALAALIVVCGGYDQVLQSFADAIEEANKGSAFLPEGETARQFALAFVRFAPAEIAGSTLLIFCVNLYGAARSTALSHRLARPWPDLPISLVLPAPMAALALASLTPAFLLPAPACQFAWIVVGALGAAFVLQGLAALHALSRGLPMRPLLLGALYFCCLAGSNWTLPAVAIVGLIESFVSLRARAAASKSKI
jgi:hypothetical protein